MIQRNGKWMNGIWELTTKTLSIHFLIRVFTIHFANSLELNLFFREFIVSLKVLSRIHFFSRINQTSLDVSRLNNELNIFSGYSKSLESYKVLWAKLIFWFLWRGRRRYRRGRPNAKEREVLWSRSLRPRLRNQTINFDSFGFTW